MCVVICHNEDCRRNDDGYCDKGRLHIDSDGTCEDAEDDS